MKNTIKLKKNLPIKIIYLNILYNIPFRRLGEFLFVWQKIQ